MTLLLIEDEYPAAERLQRLLARVAPAARVVGTVASVAEGEEWFAANPAPDLVLSDIQLADGLSFELFDRVVLPSPVIFTTSYDAYALRAFKVHSLDYLLKPIKEDELRAALDKYRTVVARVPVAAGAAGTEAPAPTPAPWQRLEHLLDTLPLTQAGQPPRVPWKSRFLVRRADQLIPVATAEVAWLCSQHEQVTLITHQNRRYVVDYTLEQLEKLLDPTLFFRVNRQVLATADAIERIDLHFNGKLKLTLRPAATEDVLVSREKASAFRAWLEG